MINSEKYQEEMKWVAAQLKANLSTFENDVPCPNSEQLMYQVKENTDWTAGFWIGMLQLISEFTQDVEVNEVIENQLLSFKRRLTNEINLDTHDIGFLYSLSAVKHYRKFQDESSKKMIIESADYLMKRYSEKAGIIQAWGTLDDANESGRMIIDCTMNLPLLYVASNVTGESKYYNAAYRHIKNSQKYLIREDNTTYHTFFMDTITGEPKFGKTAQGLSDNSCWSRGQAWGIYGFVLSYMYTGDATLLDSASHLADYFIEHLPVDLVAYWDLDFSKGSEPRDSSAGAIAVCGLLELSKQLPLTNKNKEKYQQIAVKILESLMNDYTTKNVDSNGLLQHAVYSKPDNRGVDECCIWGDYFYVEALSRVLTAGNFYW